MSDSAMQGTYFVLALEEACGVARRAALGGDSDRLIATLEAIASSAGGFARALHALRALEHNAALSLATDDDGR